VKEDYYRQLIRQAEGNTKEVWKVVREITNEAGRKESTIQNIYDNKGNLISSEQEIANTFNEYFTTVGLELDNRIKHTSNLQQSEPDIQSSIFLNPVDDEEITKAINQLKAKGSSGTDGISNALLKKHYKIFIKPLKYIVNLIFKSGVVPKHFKISVVVPIYKSGDKLLTENYRPISLINNISKIFEKCLKTRIYNFIEVNKVISNKQYGFRKNLSTQDAILCLCDKIMKNFDKNKKKSCNFLRSKESI